MAYQKRVISGGSEKVNRKEFKVKKEKGSEEECFVIFDTDVDYMVDKLSTDEMPASIDGKPITWFVNFWVKDQAGKFVNGIPYSLLIPPLPANMKLVIFDGEKAFYYSGAIRGRAHNGKQYQEIRLDMGDPGSGTSPGT